MIRYNIDYQYMRKTDARPIDDGEVIGIDATDQSGLVLLPNVGDFVHVEKSAERVGFTGEVLSRAFFYTRHSDDTVLCHVNIVVQETDDDWGRLIKQ